MVDSLSVRCITFFAALLVACASAPPPPAAPPPPPPPPRCASFEIVQVDLSAEAQLNPDREGFSRSVVVRLYQLEGPDPFLQADYDELWHNPQPGAAARTIVGGPEELVLIPGKFEQRALKRNPRATHVGVAAKFREYQGAAGWKVVAALSPANPCPPEQDPIAGRVGLDFANYVVRLR